MIDPRNFETHAFPCRDRTKRFDDSPTGSIPFSLFQRDESRRKKNEERKAHAVYRVLRAIHTDVIPTRPLLLLPLVEGREKFPMRIGKGIQPRGIEQTAVPYMYARGNSTLGEFLWKPIRIRTFLELIRSDASNEIRYYSPSRITVDVDNEDRMKYFFHLEAKLDQLELPSVVIVTRHMSDNTREYRKLSST